jgi:hypothetical protein
MSKKTKIKLNDFMDGFQDHRKANSDPELMPKNLKALFIKRGEDYERGWKKAGKEKYPK